MRSIYLPFAILIAVATPYIHVQCQTTSPWKDKDALTKTILHLDSIFWNAYNTCDIEGMSQFIAEDIEFYHDKGGLTTTNSTLMESIKNNLCARSDWRLRREALPGTVRVFPLNEYGAIISGEHYFYIRQEGKHERLDGLAKFTHVWQYKDGQWKMKRILSYDHGPAPYKNTRVAVKLSPTKLKTYKGSYQLTSVSKFQITPFDDGLILDTGNNTAKLYPLKEDHFFSKEKDLQFEFIKDHGKVTKVVVLENGDKVDEGPKKD